MAVYTGTASAGTDVTTVALNVTEDGAISAVHVEVYGKPMGALAADLARAEVGFGAEPGWDFETSMSALARVHSAPSVALAAATPPFQSARSVVLSGLRVPVRAGEPVVLHVQRTPAVTAAGSVTVVVG